MRDWWAVLGLEPGAPPAEIRKAFHVAALRLHPDKNASPAAAHDFALAREAYAALSAEAARRGDAAGGGARIERGKEAADAAMARFADKLSTQEGRVAEPRPVADRASMLASLREESRLQAAALAEILAARAAEADLARARTLSDGSRVFPSLAAAREFVDTHAPATLMGSIAEREYSPQYELATLERLRRRADARAAAHKPQDPQGDVVLTDRA